VTITIDNRKESTTTGQWSNPGAKLYDDILKASNWKTVLEETYLIAPTSKITNNPRERTTYSSSDVGYPHHVIRNGKLVVHVAGLRASYSRAKQQGIFRGEVKAHLERHYKELGLYEESNMNPENVQHQVGLRDDVKKALAIFQDNPLTSQEFLSLTRVTSRAKMTQDEVKKIIAMYRTSRLSFDEFISLIRILVEARLMNMEHGASFEEFLQHHGVLGMRWGYRRERGPDGRVIPGSYVKRGGQPVSGDRAAADAARQSIPSMTNAELRQVVERMNLEQQYRRLGQQDISAGRKFVQDTLRSIGQELCRNVAMNSISAMTDAMDLPDITRRRKPDN